MRFGKYIINFQVSEIMIIPVNFSRGIFNTLWSNNLQCSETFPFKTLYFGTNVIRLLRFAALKYLLHKPIGLT